jgi:ring-1,2-phenylacetyl-CoA epoxidase subunit PaaA
VPEAHTKTKRSEDSEQMKVYDEGQELPEEYKAALIDLLSFQADSEFAGGQRVAENLRLAPRPEEAYRISKKAMEECGHAWYCWGLLENLGVDINVRLRHLIENPRNPDPKVVKVINGFKYENWTPLFEDWADVAMFSTVVTPAAVAFLGQYRESSYFPWRRVSERIWQEEKGHLAFGVWAARRIIQFEGQRGMEKLQSAVPKFMRMGLGFAGRPADDSENFAFYNELGLKLKTPEVLKEEYLDLVSARLSDLHLEVPKNIEPDYEMRVGYAVGDTYAATRH